VSADVFDVFVLMVRKPLIPGFQEQSPDF